MTAFPAQFERHLKEGRPKPVYLLHGQEGFLIEAALEALLSALIPPSASDWAETPR